MKKVLTGLLVIVMLLTVSVFILISKELTVSKITLMQVNENALFRCLSSEDKWRRWWPEEKKSVYKEKTFTYDGFTYRLSKILHNEVEIKITQNANTYHSKIIIIPVLSDSVAVQWKSSFVTSANPLVRILKYRQARAIKKNMEVILDRLRVFSEKEENVYAYNIHRTTIKDTFLIADKMTSTHYPSTKEIYNLVDNLKKYISSEGARETNYPMLNITTNDSIQYKIMVAIPTNKELAGIGNISFKRMVIYKDKTVLAEVKGGPEAIKNAYKELDLYMQDYGLTNPVIHWESLITDRSKETDNNKWVTKIYMPIV